MKGFREFESIHLCVQPIDFRSGILRMSVAIEVHFGHKALTGNLFLFTNKSKRNIRAIYWDRTGFAMWQKALEKDRFPWPKMDSQNKLKISHEEIDFILRGINPWKIKSHQDLLYKIF
jgi:transposase